LINKPIAAKAVKYQVADTIPLRKWKNGAVVLSGLTVDNQEREDVPMYMLIADPECDIHVLGLELEGSYAQLVDRL
jgi:hypothetical protein